MMRARMVSSLTLSHLSAFARGKRGIFRVVSVGDQSAGCETEGKSCSHYKTEYFICRCPHYASLIFLQLSGIMSCLKSIKQGQSTPPPEKTKQYIVLLACNHMKNLRYKNAKGSTRSMSPDAKRSTGIIVPLPMQQERHAGRDPSQAAGRSTRTVPPPHTAREPHSGGSHSISSVVLERILAHARHFSPPRNRTPSVSA